MYKKIFVVIVFTLLIFNSIRPQTSKENWVSIFVGTTEALYINVTGLSIYTGDEIFVWALEESKNPLEMDGVDGDIYKTKTYYLINKKLMRYSILQVMYFNNENDVLKNYTYDHSMSNSEFKYSTPIMEGSDVEKILKKCSEYIQTDAKSEN